MASRFWCDGRLELTVEGPDICRSVLTDKPYARIGSHARADLVLPGNSTPRRSLYLHATDEGIQCVGLFHRGPDEIRLSKWLQPGDWVPIGPYRIAAQLQEPHRARRHAEARQTATGTDRPDRKGAHLLQRATDGTIAEPTLDATFSPAAPNPVIEVVAGGRKLGIFLPRRRFTVVGRRFPSHFVIADKRISATHCVLYWHAGTLWVVDLLSQNGTWKEGQRIQAAFLRPGKSIAIGPVELVFVGETREAAQSDADPQTTFRLDSRQPTVLSEEQDLGDIEPFEPSVTSLVLDDVYGHTGHDAGHEAEKESPEEARTNWDEKRRREESDFSNRKKRLEDLQDQLRIERERLETARNEFEGQLAKFKAEKAVHQAELQEQVEMASRRIPAPQPVGQERDPLAAENQTKNEARDAPPQPQNKDGHLDGDDADDVYERMTDRLVAFKRKKKRRFIFW